MEFFRIDVDGYEQVIYCNDPESGLKSIIAINNTLLGPALGGTRIWPYQSEKEALEDVLRLAKGMTYKAAAAELKLGGGKAVIIAGRRQKTGELLKAYGRFVDSLGGRYITAEDVGSCQEDMDIIAAETRHVVGKNPANGGSGDPSPFTALGVFQGIRAAAVRVFGSENLQGKVVAVQGLGHVGYHLCGLLAKAGARLVVTDIDPKVMAKAEEEFRARAVAQEEIYGVTCDIFAPCALGAVINDDTLPLLKCQVIAGAANNVLAEPRHGELLHKQGILYVPDYVINAGGLINVAMELEGYYREKALKRVEKVYDNCSKVLEIAQAEAIPTYLAADRLAEQRLAEAQREVGAVER